MSRSRFDPGKAAGAGQMELFGPDSGGPLSVSALTRKIKRAVEDHLPQRVLVAGEISNYKRHGSGHVYLSLKDAGSQIPAVMWKSKARKVRFDLGDGLAVIARGQVEVYEPHGKYQLIIEELLAEGVGALELAFRQLKEKLAREGLFEASAKKPLPVFPWTIGLVTSATGAAVKDMIRTLSRRFAVVRILVYPVAVQGAGAAEQIAGALSDLDAGAETMGGIDLIIVGRGGGSLEDLWAFNEEEVARTIYACRIPVISAVGHETDVTIADMVADVRAATPTAGAELAVPVLAEVLEGLAIKKRQFGRFMGQAVQTSRDRLERVLASSFFRQPLSMVMSQSQRLDGISVRLGGAMLERLAALVKLMGQLEGRLCRRAPRVALSRAERSLRSAAGRLRLGMHGRLRQAERGMYYRSVALARRSPGQLVGLKSAGLVATSGRLSRAVAVLEEAHGKRLRAIGARLEAVGPERVLARGYSVTSDALSGEVITEAKGLKVGQEILTRLHKGRVRSRVKRLKDG